MDALEHRVLSEVAVAGQLSADELAQRLNARHWADLSSALSHLVSSGYVTVSGPLGRAETRYRIHARGRAALSPD
jgi:predicted ArsR family transcriptional regulator